MHPNRSSMSNNFLQWLDSFTRAKTELTIKLKCLYLLKLYHAVGFPLLYSTFRYELLNCILLSQSIVIIVEQVVARQ